jgi:hypothetical protein
MMKKKVPDLTDKHVGARVRMRRMMLKMSQEKLGRLQHISNILQVPVSFFFEGGPHLSEHSGMSEAHSPAYVADFLATSDGLSLTKSFMKIKNGKLRRRIVELVEQVAGNSR